jgi:hypothetical protein
VSTLLYDLSNRPASFDFVTCMATATTLGADHVRFVLNNGWKKKNYTPEQARERYRSIVEPAVALWGLKYSVGEREGNEISHFFPAAVAAYKKHGFIRKIPHAVEDRGYLTITLRNSPNRTPARDSKNDEWMAFAARQRAKGVKVIVLRDYDERPLELGDRMKLYAGAHMNLMVINGPVTLCIHSEAPYLCMRTIGCENSQSTSPQFMASIGITPGFQFPWANARQRMSYKDDTLENIEAEYEALEAASAERKAA